MEKIELKTILNHTFWMDGCTSNDYLSVLSAGYIITPDGCCIIIPDGKDHEDIYSTYLYQYLETDYQFYQATEGIQVLTKEPCSCVVYNGIRPTDLKQVYQENTNAVGYGIFFLPMTNNLTKEQKIACQKLLDSNRSIFGNREKLNLSFGSINGNEISRKEFENKIATQFQKLG